MQQFGVIDDLAVDEGLGGFFHVAQFADDGGDIEALHALIGTATHAAAQQDFAVGDDFGHADVFVMRVGAHAMPGSVGGFFVGSGVELAVAHFGAHFALDDLAVLNGHNQVMRGAAKMLADGFPVVCDQCDFHVELLFHIFKREMPAAGFFVFVGRVKHQKDLAFGFTVVLPAMGEVGLKDQAVASLQDVILFVHPVVDFAGQTVYKFMASMNDHLVPAASAGLEGDEELLQGIAG